MRPENLKNFSRRFSVSPERRLASRPRRNQLQCDTIIDQTVTEGAELRVETSSERFCLPIQSWTQYRLSHILTSRKFALTSRHLQSKRPCIAQEKYENGRTKKTRLYNVSPNNEGGASMGHAQALGFRYQVFCSKDRARKLKTAV